MHRAVGTLIGLMLLLPASAQATPITIAINFTVAFHPPEPVLPGDPIFEPLTGGVMTFFQTLTLGSLNISTLKSGEEFHPPDPIFPPDPIQPGDPMFMTFTALAGIYAAFAYPPDPIVPDGPPTVPPMINLGTFPPEPVIGSQLNASGPIYAFASPGTLVGDWSVTATVLQPVPEPTSLLLFGTGALGVLARTRRRKQP